MSVSQQLDKPLILPVQVRSFNKTDTCFDWLEHVVKRLKQLLVDLGALAFLVYELIKMIANLSTG